MRELEDLAKELDKVLREEREEKERLSIVKNYLYKAYILGFSPFNLREYERVDERYPRRDCRKP